MDRGDSRARVPVPVQLARALLAVVAASHLAVPIVMWATESTLRDQLADGHPEFGAAEVSQLLSVGFSIISWASSPMFHWMILVVGAAQLVLVALLWLPGTARRFFTPDFPAEPLPTGS